ncbi:hypothetical protein M3J09_007641 [Ascochyta lentis]
MSGDEGPEIVEDLACAAEPHDGTRTDRTFREAYRIAGLSSGDQGARGCSSTILEAPYEETRFQRRKREMIVCPLMASFDKLSSPCCRCHENHKQWTPYPQPSSRRCILIQSVSRAQAGTVGEKAISSAF